MYWGLLNHIRILFQLLNCVLHLWWLWWKFRHAVNVQECDQVPLICDQSCLTVPFLLPLLSHSSQGWLGILEQELSARAEPWECRTAQLSTAALLHTQPVSRLIPHPSSRGEAAWQDSALLGWSSSCPKFSSVEGGSLLAPFIHINIQISASSI